MEFDPQNNIVKRCIQGMILEEHGKGEEAANVFLQAWNEATTDFEKFMAAHYVARHQKSISDKLKWTETALQLALSVDNISAQSALPALYSNLARCYEESGDHNNAKKNSELGETSKYKISDKGPFYHGTKADLRVGDFLNPGNRSNYQADLVMNHIYFTAMTNGAGLAAALAKGDGRERVYIVEPTGPFESDPNVTDKKFPGNPTRSYRTGAPLKIVGEVTEWVKQTPEQIQEWRRKLENNKGEIIN
jgi:rifampin ADP-ribosylating transferase